MARKEFCRLAKELYSAEKESGRLPKEFDQAGKECCRLAKELESAKLLYNSPGKQFGQAELLSYRAKLLGQRAVLFPHVVEQVA